ncbi:MAG: cyclic pyranopterin monophosphate synthase MoaC [Candidatus Omnitrophica bacterium]|nr:cyclic pyranopterin monophosphate synthase MoaC [Candidatus Omnitrophota bacterium]
MDPEGKARMVDISHKPPLLRVAKARGRIQLAPATVALIQTNQIQKGEVLTVAELAGIQGAKRTADLIPLCHPLALSQIQVRASMIPEGVEVRCEVSCIGPTGVEMEALTAVSVALLTVYDMCKAVDKTMVLGPVELTEKTKHELK